MSDLLEQIAEAPADHYRRLKISPLDGDQLLELSRFMKLSLSREDMLAVQKIYADWGREPTDVELEVIAQTDEGEIMGLKHKQHPTYGVQFHPESILTEHGKQLLKNFLDIKIAPLPTTEPVMLKPFIAKVINRTDLTDLEA